MGIKTQIFATKDKQTTFFTKLIVDFNRSIIFALENLIR